MDGLVGSCDDVDGGILPGSILACEGTLVWTESFPTGAVKFCKYHTRDTHINI
jgi:hypothetical protein